MNVTSSWISDNSNSSASLEDVHVSIRHLFSAIKIEVSGEELVQLLERTPFQKFANKAMNKIHYLVIPDKAFKSHCAVLDDFRLDGVVLGECVSVGKKLMVGPSFGSSLGMEQYRPVISEYFEMGTDESLWTHIIKGKPSPNDPIGEEPETRKRKR